jgi:hypothetical protein
MRGRNARLVVAYSHTVDNMLVASKLGASQPPRSVDGLSLAISCHDEERRMKKALERSTTLIVLFRLYHHLMGKTMRGVTVPG